MKFQKGYINDLKKKSHKSKNSGVCGFFVLLFLAEHINNRKVREGNRNWMKMQIAKAELRLSESLILGFVLGPFSPMNDSFHPTTVTWHMSPLLILVTAIRGSWVSNHHSPWCLGNKLSGTILFKCVTSIRKYRMRC